MALKPPPFNTKDSDLLADLCQGMAAPIISVVYDDFQLEFLEVGTKNYLSFFFSFFNNCGKNLTFFSLLLGAST